MKFDVKVTSYLAQQKYFCFLYNSDKPLSHERWESKE
jgi:hypothetical protein